MDLRKEIEKRLVDAINGSSLENESNTPDYVLAGYLTDCLAAFDKATNERTRWIYEEGL